MQINDLLSTLNYNYYPSNDEIIITWFDKESVSNCLDTLPDDPDVLDEAWARASSNMQETLDHWISMHDIQYDLAANLLSAIEDVQEEWGEDA